MVFEMQFVRKAYTQVLAHEMKKLVRMLRAFPIERFDHRDSGCGHTARELAESSVAHLRRIGSIAYGEPAQVIATGPRPRGSILLELETTYLGAHAALTSLPAARWGDVVPTPAGLKSLSKARRGELLWLALRELGRHDQHFSMHLNCECQVGGNTGGGRRRATAPERQEEIAFSA